MYSEHPSFELPPDRDAPLWRYMDLAKFIQMLISNSLWFSRADCLGDPFEGYPPISHFSLSQDEWQKVRDLLTGEFEGMEEFAERLRNTEFADRLKLILEYQKSNTDPIRRTAFNLTQMKSFTRDNFINCWHHSVHESEAMWKLYLQGDQGIVIRSSVQRLIDSISDFEPPVLLGKARYIDHDSYDDPIKNFFDFALFKRQSFEHENEIRAVLWGKALLAFPDISPSDTGVSVPCNLDRLIEEVRVAPTAKSWFVTVVQSVSSQYGFTFTVRPSTLGSPPIW